MQASKNANFQITFLRKILDDKHQQNRGVKKERDIGNKKLRLIRKGVNESSRTKFKSGQHYSR